MTENYSSLKVKLPPLENGGRLTRSEFERRYHTMSSVKKAELLESLKISVLPSSKMILHPIHAYFII